MDIAHMDVADEQLYADFPSTYLPDLFKYVVPIVHEDDDGKECLGSGVWVRVGDRHLIASARHCVERYPRLVLGDEFILQGGRILPKQTAAIRTKFLHPVFDLGVLEIDSSSPPKELLTSQLSFDQIVGGSVHIVGHPICLSNLDVMNGRRLLLTKATFCTVLVEASDACLKFAYPVEGQSYDTRQGKWIRAFFPTTPHGFSGGACFGVTKTSRAGLEIIEYKLLGIQYAWDESARHVKVIPIKHWVDLVTESYGEPCNAPDATFLATDQMR
jgi:hypothetical protein